MKIKDYCLVLRGYHFVGHPLPDKPSFILC